MDLPPTEIEYEEAHIFDDDTATIVTAVATCFFVAFVAVTLRLISRRLKHQCLQHDDYMAIVALVRSLIFQFFLLTDLSFLKAFAAALSATVGIGKQSRSY